MTTKPKTHRFDTLSLHAGSRPDPATGARATPIYQTSSFVFPDTDHAAALFNMERAGHVYSRLSNPDLRGARGANRGARRRHRRHRDGERPGGAASRDRDAAVGRASHIVASRSLYGGSHNLLDYTLPRFGIETTFVDPRDLDGWRAAIRPQTRLLFGETLGNPGLDVLDIPRVAELAHEHGLPLLVDSTFTTPWLMRPFELGADLVFHSATKFLSGHGVVIGGVLVDSGRFDWSADKARDKFPTLTAPYAGFHDMVFAEESSTAAFLLRARREGIRDFGACMAPMTAFQILQGIETLPVRMARHVENTRAVVAFLREHPLVAGDRLSGVAGASRSRAGAAPAAARLRRRVQLQPPRHARAGQAVHRSAAALFASRERRRREVAGDPSGVDDAFPDVGRGPAARRHHRRHDSAVDRARGPDDLIEDLSRALYAAGKA